eukprot:scaffold20147_cov63-Phaeocystis_antarctica.AAC.5
MFTTFSESLSDPPTRNRMQTYRTKASSSLGHEASTFMKGSSQTRTSAARCSRRAHVDISIGDGQPPGERSYGKLVSAQECMHTRMALPVHARTPWTTRSLWWQLVHGRRATRGREGGKNTRNHR